MPIHFLSHTFITVHSILGNRMVLCWYKDKRNGCFLKNNCSFISDKKMTIEPWLYYFISDYSFYSSMYASNMGTNINISFCYWKSMYKEGNSHGRKISHFAGNFSRLCLCPQAPKNILEVWRRLCCSFLLAGQLTTTTTGRVCVVVGVGWTSL